MKDLVKLLIIATAICGAQPLMAQEEELEETTQIGLLGEEPVIEHRADRVVIFPQRMALDENTSVMDLLMMFPESLRRTYEDLDDKYVVRVENLNHECDVRVFLTTLKAKYVEKIQICDNPDVMKGSKGFGGVIDLNMVRGTNANDIYVGMEFDTKSLKHLPVANAVYGNGKTDVLVTASIEDASKSGDYNGMARCHAKINSALNDNHNLMYDVSTHYSKGDYDMDATSRFYGAQIQYDGIFNEAGTALSVSADVEYYDDCSKFTSFPISTKDRAKELWQVYIVELWTPLVGGLELCAGWELDYANTNVYFQKEKFPTGNSLTLEDPADAGFDYNPEFVTYNNDFYAQLDYTAGPLQLSLGDRMMCYHYGMGNEKIDNQYNLIVASAILTPNWHHQIQGSYYRRFIGPDYLDIHNYQRFDEMGSTVSVGNPKINYQPGDVYRLMYTYSTKKFWTSVIGRYIDTRDQVVEAPFEYLGKQISTFVNDPASFSITNIDASLTYTFGALTLTAGGSYYNQTMGSETEDYYYARISPMLTLPGQWKINAHAVWCSDKSPEKLYTDADAFAMLSVQKTFGKHLTIAADWHDMFCSDLNRGNFRILYRF